MSRITCRALTGMASPAGRDPDRAGGKGLNVARTLLAIGAQVQVTGLAGGITGEQVVAELGELGVPASFTRIGGETRRTFAVVYTARGRTALFDEPGPWVGQDEYAEFCVKYEKALAGCSAVVLSGSLPPGLPPDAYAGLGAMAAAAGVPAVLDAHGEALRRGAAARPAIVKPNLAELEALACRTLSTARGADKGAVALAARELMAAGRRRSWSRSEPTGCGPSPARAAGRRCHRPTWGETRPARGMPWPRAWRTGLSWDARGRSGCGTRPRSAPRRPPRRSRASSATLTTPRRWPVSG